MTTTTASFTANRVDLNRALARLTRTVDRKAPNEVLRKIRLRVNGYVKLSAANAEMRHDERLRETERSGNLTALVDAKVIKAAMLGARGKTLQVHVYGETLSVNGATLPIEPVDGWPSSDVTTIRLAANQAFGCKSAVLLDLLSKVQFASGDAGARYALSGAMVQICARGLNVVATDGRRLAHAVTGKPNPESPQIIVPADTVEALMAALKHSDAVRLAYSQALERLHVTCRTDNVVSTEITSRLVDGRFPAWRDSIPADYTFCGRISADSLVGFCNSCKAIEEDKQRVVDLTINPADQDCYLSYRTANGEVNRLIPCLTDTAYCFAPVPLCVGLNWRYLLDFASACKGEDIYLHAVDPSTLGEYDGQEEYSVLFKCGAASYVVMPVAQGRN